MGEVLVLGAGRVAGPAVRALLAAEHRVTVADLDGEAAKRLVTGSEGGGAVTASVTDPRLSDWVAAADVVLSLIPPRWHPQIARQCLAQGTPLVTSSYVSDAIRALDADARAAGVPILMEMGESPGLDHIATKRLIDGVLGVGGSVTGVRSFAAGLLDVGSRLNPTGHRASWSPRGLLEAARRDGVFIEAGQPRVRAGGAALFASPWEVQIPGLPRLEAYPNGDARTFAALYGVPEVQSFQRGLLRYVGWCPMMTALARAGFLDDERPLRSPVSPADVVRRHLGIAPGTSLRQGIARSLGLAADDDALQRLSWLGLFDETPVPATTAMDLAATMLEERWQFAAGERDLVIVHAEVEATMPGESERRSSTLVLRGDPYPEGDSAMATSVGLTAAIGVGLVLEGQLTRGGVQQPTTPEIYEPVLAALQRRDIQFVHRREHG